MFNSHVLSHQPTNHHIHHHIHYDRHAKSGISSIIASRLSYLTRRLFGGQHSLRRDAEPRTVAGRSSSPTIAPPEGNPSMMGMMGRMGHLTGKPPIPPMRTKRVMRNVRYNVEMELSRPLGWSSRDSSSFKYEQHQHQLDHQHQHQEQRLHQHEHQQHELQLKSEHSFPGQFLVRAQAHERSPSTQASVRGSFRSEGSGQSALHASQSHGTASSIRKSPFMFAPHLSPGRLSSPERFRTTSAMQMMAEEPSMGRVASASPLDRSSMLQSAMSMSGQRELPLLRPIHQHQHIYQNIGPFAHTGYFRATMPLPKAIRPIPYHPAMMGSGSGQHVPYSPRSTLALRHSQRRRYDMKIAQIRRERDSRVQLQYNNTNNSRPPFVVGNNRLCQV